VDVNALLMDERDNVVTCVAAVAKGGQIVYQKGGEMCVLTVEDDIPYCHKAAIEDLPRGAQVRKYGEVIGQTTIPIGKGHWVNHENIISIPRDYESEFICREKGNRAILGL